jgi:hypothetical protein
MWAIITYIVNVIGWIVYISMDKASTFESYMWIPFLALMTTAGMIGGAWQLWWGWNKSDVMDDVIRHHRR